GLARLDVEIRQSWHLLNRPPRARPARTDRLYQRGDEGALIESRELSISIPKKPTAPSRRKPIDRACDRPLSELAPGELATVIVEQAAKDEGISARTLDRARSRLKIISKRTGFGKTGQSWLSLPPTSNPAQDAKKTDAAES